MQLRFARPALADLDAVFGYILEQNPAAAHDMIDAIEHGLEALRQYPRLGRDGRIAGTRELIIAGTPFIAAYRVGQDAIEVLAVIHSARRWPRKLE
ncbi:MAG: type II toxin-antitoxin system RelE/ParE family toxin [Pseudomonadota bacterium]